MHVLKQCDVPGQSKVGVGPLVALEDGKQHSHTHSSIVLLLMQERKVSTNIC